MFFVTGGTGFIGSYILFHLVNRNESVIALKRKSSNIKYVKTIFTYMCGKEDKSKVEFLFNKIKWVNGDITDTEALSENLDGVDCIIHSAAMVSFNSSLKNEILNVNVSGTANLIDLAVEKGIKRFVHISSVASVNRKHNNTVDESFSLDGQKFTSVYSESKFRSEMEVWRGMAEGLNVLIVNPGIVIGPSDINRKDSSSKLFGKILKGLKIFPSGKNAFIDVRDVAVCTLKLLENRKSWGERYILISENYTYENLIKKAANYLKVEPPKFKIDLYIGYSVWLIDKIRSFITQNPQIFKKEIIYTANRNFMYSNEKFKQIIDHEFIPIEISVKDSCEFLLKQKYRDG